MEILGFHRATATGLMTFALICAPLAANASPMQINAIRLNMTSQMYGDVKFLVSSKCVKFEIAKLGLTLIALPPDAKISAFNTAKKTVFRADSQSFMFPGTQTIPHQKNSREGTYFRTGKTMNICGLKADEFANYKKEELPSILQQRVDAARSGRRQTVVSPCEIWATADVAVPNAFRTIISGITQIQEVHLSDISSRGNPKSVSTLVPLRIFRIFDDGSKTLLLDTKSALKTKATEKDLEVPKGYRTVAEQMLLFVDDDETMDMELEFQKIENEKGDKSRSNSDSLMSDFAEQLRSQNRKQKK